MPFSPPPRLAAWREGCLEPGGYMNPNTKIVHEDPNYMAELFIADAWKWVFEHSEEILGSCPPLSDLETNGTPSGQ
jgi:hypothetical protein